MQMQATDLSARLLATENLTVVRSNVRTASFDIKSRVLTLPMWKDMTPEIEDMLVGHEVGHALYTGDKYIEPLAENPKMMSYMNILEDVRIEKLIKRKYPGLRKRMNEGYKQLNDRDFFGIQKLDMESLNLIDRINLYFKAGFQCGVKFDADERPFVNRAERTETIEEVIELAHDLYAFAKEQAEKRKEERRNAGKMDEEDEEEKDEWDIDVDSSGEWDEEEGDEDEFDRNSAGGRQQAPQLGKEEDEDEGMESVTERAFQEKLADAADQDTVYAYHSMEPLPFDVVIGYKQVLKELDFNFEDMSIGSYYTNRVYGSKTPEVFSASHLESVQKFKADSTSSVNYLVKEFEMKKSAQLYKRAQISKIGSLDMRKVYAYKLQDDLFKRVTTIPKGKNHGMMFLLDWSGSMSDVIEDTLKQVINLAMFCNKAQIPYRVFAFTSQHSGREDQEDIRRDYFRSLESRSRLDPNLSVICSHHFNLLELFSDKMSMSEFNTMVKKVLDPRVFWHKGYDLGGTPLNEGLMWVYHNIGEYMKNHRIEKMNFITLSDGAGGTLNSTQGISRYGSTINGKYCKVQNLVRDPVTKKTYPFGQDTTQQTETLLKMISDRHNVRTIGFYICSNRRRHLECAIKDNVSGFQGNVGTLVDTMRKKFKEDGFYSLTSTGHDDLFIIPSESTKIAEEELVVKSDMTSRRLATSLGKFLNVKKTSRVLLSRFINYVA